ncbi:hypothetical protein G7Y79_00004g015320 [Physcia stellaris]|nr:hypothetical protein G7Y79_00004g015320 [Physcia stellaris]
MLFFSFFKTLVDQEVIVELKNDISIKGTLKSVDQYLNIKLDDIGVLEEVRYPHLGSDHVDMRWEAGRRQALRDNEIPEEADTASQSALS